MLTAKDLYEQGSAQCKQYSALTMQVRTMAQHVLIGYAVGMGIIVARATESDTAIVREVALGFSVVLAVFASVLWTLNHHYSYAFRRIRDHVLCKLEEAMPENPLAPGEKCEPGNSEVINARPAGPWSAHRLERSERRLLGLSASNLAWNAPFWALLVVSAGGCLWALL